MIVVADTAPLNYLILIDHADILRSLFGRVVIPNAVFNELRHPSAPQAVRAWVSRAPAWLEVKKIKHTRVGAALRALDAGEREAICLALEIDADLLLIDEKAGRKAAADCELRVAGTLAVLEDAGRRKLLDFPKALERLKKTNFRMSADLLEFFRRSSIKRVPR